MRNSSRSVCTEVNTFVAYLHSQILQQTTYQIETVFFARRSFKLFSHLNSPQTPRHKRAQFGVNLNYSAESSGITHHSSRFLSVRRD